MWRGASGRAWASGILGYLAAVSLGCGGPLDAGLETSPEGTVREALTGSWWQPVVHTTWDWQLQTPVNVTSANVDVYDIDMFDNDASVMAKLHSLGRKVICYVDVGSWENYRPDAKSFPASVLGASYGGFPDERWLDIRQISILAPIMGARFDQAKAKGCDAIEPDNMDGYDVTAHESSGFPLTYADQITYNTWVSTQVHNRGMGVGLKNDINQTTALVTMFDFAVSEQCFQYGECQYFTIFVSSGKPVFEAEYSLATSKFCPKAIAQNISAIKKHNSLNSYRVGCW
jgi:hypothetical protein